MKTATFLILLLISNHILSQSFRLHLGGGIASYSGDLQQKTISFTQSKPVYSFGAAYNINDRLAVRVDYTHAHIAADDKKSTIKKIMVRNLNFQSIIKEVTVTGEYTWTNDYTGNFVPYVFGGIGVYKFNPYTFDSNNHKVVLYDLSTEGQGLTKYPNRRHYSRTQLNIPFGAGFKYNLNSGIFVALEAGVRKLFTDYLDDVSSTYVDRATLLKERGALAVALSYRSDELLPHNYTYPKDGGQRGSPGKDWYYFGQLRISFRLGWNDGYGGRRFGSPRDSRRMLGCPSRF